MADVPQPASEPYSVGDRVRIYIGTEDVDNEYHGTVCEVSEVLTDSLDAETGRTLDAFSYTLQRMTDGQELPLAFRHRDLVPVDYD
jgi:hypothetical protein